MTGRPYHIPVLLQQSVDGLDINPSGVYVDLTFGGGGHSKEILSRLSSKGQLIAFDRDKDALQNNINDERFLLINSNYSNLTTELHLNGVFAVDGVLADLGISSHQIDQTERGFSFRTNSVLDLRMDTSSSMTAADIVNSYSEEKLSQIFYSFAQINNSRQVAHRIIKCREEKYIETTFDLCEILRPMTRIGMEQKYFAKVFQALRIEVNGELSSLESMLNQLKEILKSNGRISIISYESLEDKMVKNLIRSGSTKGEVHKDFYGNNLTPFVSITHKPIIPSKEEVAANPRSRSAKLRIAYKK